MSTIDLGPIEPLLSDPQISEIMIDAYDRICVERAGQLTATDARFASADDLLRLIRALLATAGLSIDSAHPIADLRLPDRSRITAVIPPVSPDGPTLVIRKFIAERRTLADLVGYDALSQPMANLLASAVAGGASTLIAGGAGAGKTTLMNCLLRHIDPAERLIVVEQNLELAIEQPRVVRLEAAAGLTVADLIAQALKMRPERIIVGELAGGEALHLLQAIGTGHHGSMALIHATAPADALARLEVMATMARVSLPLNVLRGQIAAALDLLVQINRGPDGRRRVTQICELVGVEREQVLLRDIFRYQEGAGFIEVGDGAALRARLRARGAAL